MNASTPGAGPQGSFGPVTGLPRSGSSWIVGLGTYLVVSIIGIAAGWYAARQTHSGQPSERVALRNHGHDENTAHGPASVPDDPAHEDGAGHDHDGHDHDGHDHDGHDHDGHDHDGHDHDGHDHDGHDPTDDHDHDHDPLAHPDETRRALPTGAVGGLAPETLRNLGVETRGLASTQFVVRREVRASIRETPFTVQSVHAPIGGRVESIQVQPGQTLTPGEVLVTILRDPIPRPDLSMTESILKPASEDMHQAVAMLRQSRQEIEISRSELDRLEQYESEVVPRNRVIELRFALGRSESQFLRARQELEKHGFTAAQIIEMADGNSIPDLAADAWRRALQKNGLWPNAAEQIYSALPERIRDRLWTVASIGELAARGLDSQELIDWLTTEATAGPYFPEIGALLQRGHTVVELQRLLRLGALDPLVSLRVPERSGTPDWDLDEILVQVGSRVEVGTPLVTLQDPRRLFLVTEPVGAEKADTLRAATENVACRAVPLASDAAPILEDLRIQYLRGGTGTDGTVAYLEVANHVLARSETGAGGGYRSWGLRPGLRYRLQIPVRTFDDVFVLPLGAMTDQGPAKVVFVVTDAGFRAVPVEVAYLDHEVVVVARTQGSLAKGDVVVTRGAFQLGLALLGSDKADPHAGHGH